MSVKTRDGLRSKLLASKKLKSITIQIDDEDVEVRQPTIGQLLALGTSDTQDKNQVLKLLIEYCYVPGTDERVFEPADIESLMDWPVGDWLDSFNKAFSDLANFETKTAEAAKN